MQTTTNIITEELTRIFDNEVSKIIKLADNSNKIAIHNHYHGDNEVKQNAVQQGVEYLEDLIESGSQSFHDLFDKYKQDNDLSEEQVNEIYEEVVELIADYSSDLKYEITEKNTFLLEKTVLVLECEVQDYELSSLGDGSVTVSNSYFSITVQTTNGWYMPQLNCETYIEIIQYSDYITEKNIHGDCLKEATDIAEKFAINYRKENNEFIQTDFHCSIANQSAYIRHNKLDDKYSVIIENSNAGNYNYDKLYVAESPFFDTLEEVEEFLQQYYAMSDNHENTVGLNQLINDLEEI